MARKYLISVFVFFLVVSLPVFSSSARATQAQTAGQGADDTQQAQAADTQEEDSGETALEMLQAIVQMKADLKKRMAEKKTAGQTDGIGNGKKSAQRRTGRTG